MVIDLENRPPVLVAESSRMTLDPEHEPWGLVSSSLRLLETGLDPDSMDRILSFLALSDYSNLSITSKTVHATVSTSSHLFMTCHQRVRLRFDGSSTLMDVSPELSSPRQNLELLLDRFQNLRVLNLDGSLEAIGDELIGILNTCPAALTLQSVTLHGCALSYWCAQSFRLENLEHLTLTGNSIRARISFLLKDSRKLRTVALKLCPAIRDDDIQELSKLLQDSLEDLTLNHVKILRPKAFLPRLTRASFVGCFSLYDISGLACPNLRELNISFCYRLTSRQIQGMVATLPLLDTLTMTKCSTVRSLELCSEKLRVLNACSLHSLQRLRLLCPSLEQLDVS